LGIKIDFRRIGSSNIPIKDLTRFENDELSRGFRDGNLIFVKSMAINDKIKIETLNHPLITKPIGFVIENQELKIVSSKIINLVEVETTKPGWWTPTAKAKAVVGIALALRFAHGFGLIHGGLNARNIVFDSGGIVQIADLNPIGLEKCEFEPKWFWFSEEEWSPMEDIFGFSALLFEIVIGGPVNRETICRVEVPPFVSEMIEEGLSRKHTINRSFIDIVEVLKANHFGILSGVDIEEVSEFVSWIELGEASGEFGSPPPTRERF
jgi:hypothetical protein